MTLSRILFPALTLLVLCTSGCTDVTFDAPMPLHHRNLHAFPKSLQGSWISTSDDDGKLFILRDHVYMQEDPLFLSDSTVLRKWDKGYCLSMSSEESGGRWGLFQASVNGDSLTILHVTADNAEERQKIQSILGDRVAFIAEEKDEENVDGKDEENVDGKDDENEEASGPSFFPNEDSIEAAHLSPRNNRQFKALMAQCTDTLGSYVRTRRTP